MTADEIDRIEAWARTSHPWNHRELVAAVEGLCAEVRLTRSERDAQRMVAEHRGRYRGAAVAGGGAEAD